MKVVILSLLVLLALAKGKVEAKDEVIVIAN